MKKNNAVVLFFTDKFYRWSRIEYFKLKITGLPIIKRIVILNKTRMFYKETKNMTNWERYLEIKAIEANSMKIHFITALLNLKTSILTTDKVLFEKAKKDVLTSELIEETSFRELKAWIEKSHVYENDTSKVDEALKSFVEGEEKIQG